VLFCCKLSLHGIGPKAVAIGVLLSTLLSGTEDGHQSKLLRGKVVDRVRLDLVVDVKVMLCVTPSMVGPVRV